MGDLIYLREAAAHDTTKCPECFDTGVVCGACIARYKRQMQERNKPLTAGEWAGLALLPVIVVLVVLIFTSGPSARQERATAAAEATLAQINQDASNARLACSQGVTKACE